MNAVISSLVERKNSLNCFSINVSTLRKNSLKQLRVILKELGKGNKMAKKYKYSYYVFDSKEDYDLFLELIELHGFTGKYDGFGRNEVYYFICGKFNPDEINKRKLLENEIKYIRLGLEKGFDVSIYNKPEYDYAQMEAIYEGMEMGLDISWYAKPEFDAFTMRIIKLGLEKGVDVSSVAKPELDDYDIFAEILKQIHEKEKEE